MRRGDPIAMGVDRGHWKLCCIEDERRATFIRGENLLCSKQVVERCMWFRE